MIDHISRLGGCISSTYNPITLLWRGPAPVMRATVRDTVNSVVSGFMATAALPVILRNGTRFVCNTLDCTRSVWWCSASRKCSYRGGIRATVHINQIGWLRFEW